MFSPGLGFTLLFRCQSAEKQSLLSEILKLKPIEESPTFVMFALKNGVMLGLMVQIHRRASSRCTCWALGNMLSYRRCRCSL